MKFSQMGPNTTATRREHRIANTTWIHQSCVAYMEQNPLGDSFPKVPVIRLTGGTYNIGRNKAKREAISAARGES